LAILNPRYAFLEADFRNPNLKIEHPEDEEESVQIDESSILLKEEVKNTPPKPPRFYVRSYPLFLYGNTVSADIYSAALFLLIKNI